MAEKKKRTPCLNCEERHAGCHSECKHYLAFRKMIDESKERNKGLILAGSFLHENALNNLARYNRRTYK